MAGFPLQKRFKKAATLSKTTSVSIEAIEGRRLLSGSPVASSAIGAVAAAATVTNSVKDYGTTLHLQAGQSFG